MLVAFLERHFVKVKKDGDWIDSSQEDEEVKVRRRKSSTTGPGMKGYKESGSSTKARTQDTEKDECDVIPRTQPQVGWTMGLVSLSLIASWILGAVGLSFAWLLLLLVFVLTIWKSRWSQILDLAILYETMRARRRQALEQDETAEWLNFIINRWWILSSGSLFTIVKERLEPILNEAKPAVVERLELQEFTLGEQTPRILAVQAFDVRPARKSISGGPPQRNGIVNTQTQIAIQADVGLASDDFRLLLRMRLFGKEVGVDIDLAIEKLHIKGKMYITLLLDLSSPFPHVTHLGLTFTEKPQVWFSVRILKAVQMMEVPLLKTWIHSLVMDALETSLVDPGRIMVNLTPAERPTPGEDASCTLVQGVLTVTLSVTEIESDDTTWLLVMLGNQRHATTPIRPNWKGTCSFLVTNLMSERLSMKLKSKKLVSAATVAQYELPLSTLNLDTRGIVETVLQKKMIRTSYGNVPRIDTHLEYTAIPPIHLEELELSSAVPSINISSGVLFVYIHGAEGLSSGDQGECNPYCMLFNKSTKVKTTHYLRNTTDPQWESRAQFLVQDISQVSLSFVVCSWNPNKTSDPGLLGLANLSSIPTDSHIIRETLDLSGNANCACITVSVVFYGVESVARSESCQQHDTKTYGKENGHAQVMRHSSNSWMQQAKQLLSPRDQDPSGTDISDLLSAGQGLVEVSLIRAHNLVSKDLNGFSDPYCEFKVNGECKYKSTVKKKTLNPYWEESAIMGLPRTGETLDVVLWDHDMFGTNDFLGSISLTPDEIRRVSTTDSAQRWQLHGVKSGVVELKVKVISDELDTGMVTDISSTSSPKLPPHRMKGTPVQLTVDGDNGLINRHSPTYSSSSSPRFPRAAETPSPDEPFKKNNSEHRSFRKMKQKMKHGLKLRRFRSEASVNEEKRPVKSSTPTLTVTMEPSGGGESDATELLNLDNLSHAVSQPNIRESSPTARPKRPVDLKVPSPIMPDCFTGVEGMVIQVQGLHVSHVGQLYCRVKVHTSPNLAKLGRTVAKSRLIPAVPNPRFDLPFQLDHSERLPRQTTLNFEICSSTKEVIGGCRATLQDLLSSTSPDSREIHTWLSLSNGATLEIRLAHGRELKKQSRKIFRSWSVHRIGKI